VISSSDILSTSFFWSNSIVGGTCTERTFNRQSGHAAIRASLRHGDAAACYVILSTAATDV